jgi:NAD(P)-dependent dehydrogenase (short-subunit alcohol dehydrogenase family)
MGLTEPMSSSALPRNDGPTTHERWTVADMPDLSGRTAIVTGANSGLGFYAAQALARNGAAVTIAVRDEVKGGQARELMGPVGGTVEVRRLDLADLASVRAFADSWSASHPGGLDLLINNAGIMAIPRRESADGHELQFATNHLGHFALTGLLLPALIAIPHSRVVNVASGAHRMARRINFEDLMGEKKYSQWGAYGQSKLANLLFTTELQRRFEANDLTVTAVAAHPGFAATNLQGVGPAMRGARLEGKLTALANKVIAQSPQMGALPILFAATMPGLAGNSYIGPGGRGEIKGHPRLVGRSSAAHNLTQARMLWDVSEELTGVRFPLD